VCPTSFSLGEHGRIIVLSVPEGDDKVSKYLPCFATADVVVISKVDLLAHCEFDLDGVISEVRGLRRDIFVCPVSSKTGQGMEGLIEALASFQVPRHSEDVQGR
jgi:hydrogenase nickel incorporation protein HypB